MTLDNPFDAAATAPVGAELDSDSYSCFLTPALFTEEDDCFLMALMEKSSPLSPLFTFPSSSSSTSAPSTKVETVTPSASRQTAAAGESWTSTPDLKIESGKKKKSRAVPVRTSVPRPSNAWILYRSAKIKEQHTSAWQEQHAVFKNMCDLSALLDPSSSSLAAAASSSSISTATATTSPVKAPAEAPRYSLNNAAGQTLQAFVTKYIADRWRSESQEVKDHYYALSEQKKLEHARMYPDYKYTPRKPPPATTLSPDEGGDGQLVEPLDDHEVEENITPAKKSRTSTSQSAKEAPPELSPSNASKVGPARVVKRRTREKAKPKPAGLCIDVQAAEGKALVDREVDAKVLPFQQDYMADFSYPSFPSSSLLGSCADAEIPMPSHGLSNSSLNRIDSSLIGHRVLNECDTLSLDVLMKDVLQSEDTSQLLPPPPSILSQGLDPHVNDPSYCVPPVRSTGQTSTLTQRDKEKEKMPPSSRPSRKKSHSNLRSTKQLRSRNLANPAMLSPLSKKSPKRRLKKALICKDAAKIAMSKALQEEQREQQGALDSPWGRTPLFYTQQLVQQGQQQGERRADVQQDSLLVRSYDPQCAPSEVEEALQCAESLIDSFAGIAKWSSSPSVATWYGSGQGNIPTPPLLLSQRQELHQVQQPQTTESAPASLANFNSNHWQFYTQPVAELLGQNILTTNHPNSLQPAEDKLQLDGSNMAETSTVVDHSLPHVRDGSPATAMQEGGISFASKTSRPLLIDVSSDGWAVKEEDWEALLRQTVVTAASQGEALDEELNLDTARAGGATTSDEGMWDLVSLEPHPSSIDEPSVFSSSTSPSSRSPSARFWRSETTKQDKDVLELHGTFTEEQLMSKLAQLREAKSKSSIPLTTPSDQVEA